MDNRALARKPSNTPARGRFEKRGLASFTKRKTLKTDEKKFRWDLYLNQMQEEEASDLPVGTEIPAAFEEEKLSEA